MAAAAAWSNEGECSMAHSYQVTRIEETVQVNFGLIGALTQAAGGLAGRLSPHGRIVQLTEIDHEVVGIDQVKYTLAALLEDAAPAEPHWLLEVFALLVTADELDERLGTCPDEDDLRPTTSNAVSAPQPTGQHHQRRRVWHPPVQTGSGRTAAK
jgi:hypothetical protein